jgi:hypothetical protein
MTDVAVNLGGVALIGLIVWWFWLAGPRSKAVTGRGRPLWAKSGEYRPVLGEWPQRCRGRPTKLLIS